MPSHLLVDNWTLQCAAELLADGLQGEETSELLIAPDKSAFSYQPVSADLMRVRCLFQILENIILAEDIFVDAPNATSWTGRSQLKILQGIIIPKPLQDLREQWLPARERYVEELCICPAMADLHETNKTSFQTTGGNEDGYFTQLVWGGAGMAARAYVLNVTYAPHPARQSLFDRTGFLAGPRGAQEQLGAFLSEQRQKVLSGIDPSGYLARLNLPPLAAMVVQEANSLSDCLRIALQFRQEYLSLRRWLAELQHALDDGNTRIVLKRKKLLQSVAQNVDTRLSGSLLGETSVQIMLGLPSISKTLSTPVNSVRNLFGLRMMLNRLVLAPGGKSISMKLLQLLGEQNTKLGFNFERDFWE